MLYVYILHLLYTERPEIRDHKKSILLNKTGLLTRLKKSRSARN